MRWLDSNTDPIDMNLRKLQEIMKDKEACHAAGRGVTKSRTQFSDEQQFVDARRMLHFIEQWGRFHWCIKQITMHTNGEGGRKPKGWENF